jgi:uncharacterized protein YegL
VTIPLILNTQAIPRSRLGTIANLPPSVAVVYPVDGVGWELEGGKPRTATQRFFGKHRPCYAVDMSDHRRTANLSKTRLTCSDLAHSFEARVDVGFRVHDPVQVVSRNVTDALVVVYGYLTDQLRAHAAQFAIDESLAAQTRINQAFAREMVLPEGITIYLCTVQLEPDAAAREFIAGITRAKRDSAMGVYAHKKAVGVARHEEVIKDIAYEAQAERDAKSRAAMSGLQLDFRSLVLEHLVKHPLDTEKAMGLLLQLEESKQRRTEDQEQRHIDMVRFLIDKGVVRDVDMPGIRQGVLGASGGTGALSLPGAATGAAGQQELPSPAPSAVRTDTPPRPADSVPWGGSTPHRPGEPAGARAAVLVPVYVVLDASPATAACTTELSNSLRSLNTVLANSPEVGPAVRLSVLSFSDSADVLLPITEVSWQTSVPDVRAGAGCRYEPVFQRLSELVPLETERLKQQAPRVLRPVVFFLGAGVPEDGAQWPAVHDALMRHQFHPQLVACGIGGVDRHTVERLASRPELAVVAAPGLDLASSVLQFSLLVQNTVLHLGRSALGGSSELLLHCPQGLVPAITAQ